MKIFRLLVPCISLSLAAGCSGATGDADEPGGPTDSGARVDTGTDSGPDTSLPDEGTDTSPADTGTKDTGSADTGGGDSGDADGGPGWPSCDSMPTGATATTIDAIWTASATKPAFDWVSGAIVTGVSQGGCVDGKACQIFIEEGGPYASLSAVAHHAIKIFISGTGATHFTGIAVGDKVDTAGYGWRYDVGGQNEILLEVNDALRGCIKKTGTGTVDPVTATLIDLGSIAAYETTYGPVLVKVVDVSGKPATATETFGLYTTGTFDAGGAAIVSLSPYFLSGGAFTGFTSGTTTNFASIVGVFGLFMPSAGDAGPSTKYLEIYPRTMSEVVTK
jgi:hypothetical protein